MFFASRFEADAEELAYRVYVTDAIMYIGQGKAMSRRWHDLVMPSAQDFDAEKIADDIVARLGGDVA